MKSCGIVFWGCCARTIFSPTMLSHRRACASAAALDASFGSSGMWCLRIWGLSMIYYWPLTTEGVGTSHLKLMRMRVFDNSMSKPHVLKHHLPEHPNRELLGGEALDIPYYTTLYYTILHYTIDILLIHDNRLSYTNTILYYTVPYSERRWIGAARPDRRRRQRVVELPQDLAGTVYCIIVWYSVLYYGMV